VSKQIRARTEKKEGKEREKERKQARKEGGKEAKEKDEKSLFPTEWENKSHVPNHQPEYDRKQKRALPSGYVKIAIENGHRNSGFPH
jgi:hypothetical protein